MYGDISPSEAFEIEEAVNKQLNKVTHNYYIKEQREMLDEGYPLPQGQDLYDYLQILKTNVVTTIIISN